MSEDLQQRQDAGGMKAFKDALKTSVLLLKISMLFLVIAFIFSNVKNLKQYEKAIVLRFGVQQGKVIEEPGSLFAWPYPIDQVIVVPAGRTQSLSSSSFMYQKKRSAEINDFLKPGVDGYLLTADGNILHCESTLKYRVQDLEKYVFAVKKTKGSSSLEQDVKFVLQRLLDNAVLKAVAKLTLNEALDKKELIADSKLILQRSIDKLALGVKAELLNLEISVPLQIDASRRDVKDALQDASRLQAAAEIYAKSSVNEAESEAARVRSQAEIWGTRMLSRSEADFKTFEKLLVRYRKNPQQVKSMLLRDAMVEILPYLDEVFIFDPNKNRELRLVVPRHKAKKKEALHE